LSSAAFDPSPPPSQFVKPRAKLPMLSKSVRDDVNKLFSGAGGGVSPATPESFDAAHALAMQVLFNGAFSEFMREGYGRDWHDRKKWFSKYGMLMLKMHRWVKRARDRIRERKAAEAAGKEAIRKAKQDRRRGVAVKPVAAAAAGGGRKSRKRRGLFG
jgi:hypothetical protein